MKMYHMISSIKINTEKGWSFYKRIMSSTTDYSSAKEYDLEPIYAGEVSEEVNFDDGQKGYESGEPSFLFKRSPGVKYDDSSVRYGYAAAYDLEDYQEVRDLMEQNGWDSYPFTEDEKDIVIGELRTLEDIKEVLTKQGTF